MSDSWDPMDYSLPGSSVHGSLQARIMEWAAISFSRGSSWPRDRTQVCRQILYPLSYLLITFCRFSFFFNFYFYFILLYNTVLVLPYIDMNPPRVYMQSQTWTPLPPPSPQHPSGSSPCTSPKHAVSCIGHRLVIRFLHDSIHVSMPFSQIIQPFLSPSPSESKSLLYTSGSFLLSWKSI